MKKLFGVMILATLPVACGTTNPNAPEMPATADATGDASFAASGRAVRTAPPSCTPVKHVVVTLEEQQPGSAYFTVKAYGDDDTKGVLCGSPTWTVTGGRKVQLTPSLTGDAAVLEAIGGTYVVTATYPALSRLPMSGSASVTFR